MTQTLTVQIDPEKRYRYFFNTSHTLKSYTSDLLWVTKDLRKFAFWLRSFVKLTNFVITDVDRSAMSEDLKVKDCLASYYYYYLHRSRA